VLPSNSRRNGETALAAFARASGEKEVPAAKVAAPSKNSRRFAATDHLTR
jgi:hypothetical protein